MHARPLGAHVMVRPADADFATRFGVTMPGKVKDKAIQGIVIACGPGFRNESGTIVPVDEEQDEEPKDNP